MVNWTTDPSGKSASTTYANGSTESRLLSAIPSTDTILPYPPPLLSDVQTAAYSAIDAQAGITRAKYITTVAGQSETYISKAADAAAYKAAAYPFASLINYPWVQAEAVAINGATPTAAQVKAAADGILAAQAAWIALGASIEQARRAGAEVIKLATTVAAVQAAQSASVAALAAM